jgi:hypothetical protein
MERIYAAIARLRRVKHVSAAADTGTTIKDTVFCEGQQQFNRPTVGPRNRLLAVLSCIVSSHYLAAESYIRFIVPAFSRHVTLSGYCCKHRLSDTLLILLVHYILFCSVLIC